MNQCHKIKICGLSRLEDIQMANELRPDYIGFVFAPSKRQVTVPHASLLKSRLSPGISAVGVFVNQPAAMIAGLAKAGIIDMIQLHGDEGPKFIQSLKEQTGLPVIRAIRVRSQQDIHMADQLPCDYLLLDTYSKGQYGGSGQTFNWEMIPQNDHTPTSSHAESMICAGEQKGLCSHPSHPYFLAGGLNADNIRQAMKTGAYCLDLSSGAETNGYKDYNKMQQVIHMVHDL